MADRPLIDDLSRPHVACFHAIAGAEPDPLEPRVRWFRSRISLRWHLNTVGSGVLWGSPCGVWQAHESRDMVLYTTPTALPSSVGICETCRLYLATWILMGRP